MTEAPAILIVDDEKIIRKAYCLELKAAGYDAAAAASAAEALSLLAQKKFAIVYVDFTLPDMDGILLCRRIKECVPLSEVVIMSGRVDARPQLREECIAAGGYPEILQKPLQGTELTDLSKRIQQEHQASRTGMGL